MSAVPFRSLLLLSIVLAGLSASAANVTVRFEPKAVIAEGVTRGATTAWFAIVHDPLPYELRTRELSELLVDTDGDGIVRLDLPSNVIPESVWVVVDLADGKYAIEQPAGHKLAKGKLPPLRLSRLTQEKTARGSLDSGYAYLWLARPGVGAWTLLAGDGGSDDADGIANGTIEAELSRFRPLGTSPPPPADFDKDDLLVAIDPLRLKVVEIKVK